MKEWTEEEIRDKKLRGPCGLFCGACGVYIATRDGNEELKQQMWSDYNDVKHITQKI